MTLITFEGVDYIHLSTVDMLRRQMALDKTYSVPCIIWLAGHDAPVYWSECLNEAAMAAYGGACS